MKKSTPLLVSFMVPMFAAALAATSCAGGETTGAPTGTGNSTGTNGTGGRFVGGGSGGSTFGGTGGTTFGGTGGTTVGGGSGGSSTFGSGGNTGFGTGGTTVGGGTGGATVGGGTGGAVVVSGSDNASAMNGYVSNGTWMGYAFTGTFGTGTTITPVCDDAGVQPCFKAAGKQLCASGTVAASATGANGAFVGFNINQAMLTPNPANTLVPSAASMGVSLTLSAPIPGGRIQLSDALGNRWCYQVNPSGTALPTTNMAPWAMFNTMCYMPSLGTVYTKQPITQVQVLVPSAAAATTFSFCIIDARQY